MRLLAYFVLVGASVTFAGRYAWNALALDSQLSSQWEYWNARTPLPASDDAAETAVEPEQLTEADRDAAAGADPAQVARAFRLGLVTDVVRRVGATARPAASAPVFRPSGPSLPGAVAVPSNVPSRVGARASSSSSPRSSRSPAEVAPDKQFGLGRGGSISRDLDYSFYRSAPFKFTSDSRRRNDVNRRRIRISR